MANPENHLVEALEEIKRNCEPWKTADNMAERLWKIADSALHNIGRQTKVYKVFVEWIMVGEYDIEASSLEEAIDIANDQDLPDGEYLSDSFEVNEELTRDMNGPDGYKVK